MITSEKNIYLVIVPFTMLFEPYESEMPVSPHTGIYRKKLYFALNIAKHWIRSLIIGFEHAKTADEPFFTLNHRQTTTASPHKSRSIVR